MECNRTEDQQLCNIGNLTYAATRWKSIRASSNTKRIFLTYCRMKLLRNEKCTMPYAKFRSRFLYHSVCSSKLWLRKINAMDVFFFFFAFTMFSDNGLFVTISVYLFSTVCETFALISWEICMSIDWEVFKFGINVLIRTRHISAPWLC